MFFSRKLIETMIRISTVSSKDETRLYLNGVHVYTKDNVLCVEACDGHSMVREILPGDESEIGELDTILSTKDLKKLKPLLKTYKGKGSFDVEILENSVLFKVGSGVEVVSVMRINRDYPKLDSVIPGNRNNECTISLNPHYLANILDALNDNGRKKHVSITFSLDNLMSPIIVSVENDDNQTAVIMPCTSTKKRD